MHLTVLLAGALLPAKLAGALAGSLNAPSLERRLSRADATGITPGSGEHGGSVHIDWLARNLMNQSHPATAPYAFSNLSSAPPKSFVWHADPVHVEAARDQLVVQALDRDAVTADEAAQLVSLANQVLIPHNIELVPHGTRWFLLHDEDWTIETVPLVSALNWPVTMPVGPDAQTWNRLHNEIQMAWHRHEVNEQRERVGQRTINALWLYGGGRYQPLPALAFAQVHCSEPGWRGVAEAAGANGRSPDDAVANHALIVLDDLLMPKQREDWTLWLQKLAAIDQRLATYEGAALEVVLTGDIIKTFSSRPSDRYKFWRGRALSEALSE